VDDDDDDMAPDVAEALPPQVMTVPLTIRRNACALGHTLYRDNANSARTRLTKRAQAHSCCVHV
jgi:hypothetical protein